MEKVSFTEVARARLRLKNRGLTLSDSACRNANVDDLAKLTREIITGETGWRVIDDFQRLLEAPSTADVWFPSLGVQKQDSVELLLIGVADAYRRLVMPYECLPWQLFQVVGQEPTVALETLKTLRQQHRTCSMCIDPMFSQALGKKKISSTVYCLRSKYDS